MRLIVESVFKSKIGIGGVNPVFSYYRIHFHDLRKLLGCCSNQLSKSFFKSILAEIEATQKLVNPDVSIGIMDPCDRFSDQRIMVVAGELRGQKRFNYRNSFPIAFAEGQPFLNNFDFGSGEEIIQCNTLGIKFMQGLFQKGGKACFLEEYDDGGGVAFIVNISGCFLQSCDDSKWKCRGVIRIQICGLSLKPEGHCHGRSGQHRIGDFVCAFNNPVGLDERRQMFAR